MKSKILAILIITVVASIEAAKLTEQMERQERRIHGSAPIVEQEVEIVYEEPNGDEQVIEDIMIVQDHMEDQRHHVRVTPSSVHKGLVPQLWENYTGPAEPEPETVPCDVARMKCAYRAGCGMALQNYGLGCMDLVEGKTSMCNTRCRHSLIALMSTHEGERLMKCNCTGDSFCEQSKRNVQSCQKEVMYATREDTIVSCSAAQWICAADPLCSTALEYYNRFCQAMFRGKKCTARCMNSISILRRQPKASKLESCYCDGTENFDCPKIKSNMDQLCFRDPLIELDNEIDVDGHGHKTSGSSWMAKMERFLIVFSVFATLIIQWVGISFQVMVESIKETYNKPPPPPEEIGITGTF